MRCYSWLAAAISLVVAGCGNLPEYGPLEISRNVNKPAAGSELSVTTWNIGYGALGAGADFVSDGGEHMRALSKSEILLATAEIGKIADGFDTQVILFQELANSSLLTRNVDVRGKVDESLSDYSAIYWEDLGVTAAPKPLQVSHGMGVYAQSDIQISSAYELPQEPGYFFLSVKRYYAAIVTEIPIAGSEKKWVVLNIHLSAFDKDAAVRRAQVLAVFDFASEQHRLGNYVVIGGDWNMKISPTEFEHTSASEYLFWVHDFPTKLLPKGWRFGVDPQTPTVRTLEKPYVQDENFTAIMDGFAYSPNVRLRRIVTEDLGFEHTDHQPVSAVFTTTR